ncbi:hypothetical protein [Croceivirga sp. JEA036]|uniref:hypothetical protein n=1 Tax=Croceivirga sp. JEA036 TaxID=2721162 RepID=UPI00143BB8ED|nr:hypothetical protein [Croceivirga sp. JEA036]NJB35450.1 hypothetical protein [Croceivirga sp. JEA036]
MRGLQLLFCLTALWAGAQTNIKAIGDLPTELQETSGLAYWDKQVLSCNDSGNSAEIFVMNPETLEITARKTLMAENIDWEALSIDGEFGYVGDFGNNLGTRRDLKVYKFRLAALQTSSPIVTETIGFSYPEQVNFEGQEHSDFDAEAMIATENYLYIFTKQWKSMNTAVYRLPKIAGSYQAEFVQEIPINGLVTDATYVKDANTIILLGYTSILTPFLLNVELDERGQFVVQQEKLQLPIGIAQTEGITKNANHTYYVSCENYQNPPFVSSASRLFSFTLDNETLEEEDVPEDFDEDLPKGDGEAPEEQLKIERPLAYQPMGNSALAFKMPVNTLIHGLSIFDTSGRQIAFYQKQELEEYTINTSFLKPSIYYAQFYAENDRWVIPFLIR